MLRQLFRRQGRAEVGVSLAHDRQRQGANLSRQPIALNRVRKVGKIVPTYMGLEGVTCRKHTVSHFRHYWLRLYGRPQFFFPLYFCQKLRFPKKK